MLGTLRSRPGRGEMSHMRIFTDEEMQALRPATRGVLACAAEGGAEYGTDESRALVWEHGRRNFGLREAGSLAVVCPMTDDSDLCGVGIFTTAVEETRTLMNDDPGVVAGVFTCEVHPVRGFPGDAL